MSILRIAKNYLRHYSGLKKDVWHGIFLSFIESGVVGIYYFLPIYFTGVLGFNIAVAGMIISFFGIGTVIGGLVGGKLSDRFSADKICVVSLFFQACVFLFLVRLKTVCTLSLDVFLMGFFSYSFLTANHLWVLERCGELENIRLKALNLLNVASNFALAISATIISFFTIKGFSVFFEVGSILLLTLAIYFLMFQITQIHVYESARKKPDSEKIKEDKRAKLNKVLWLTLISSFLMGFVIFQLGSCYAIYIRDAFPALGVKSLSILLSINCLMVVFFQTPLGNILSKYNKILMMGIGAFFIGIGMAILPFSYSFFIAIISCVIYTLGEMLFCSTSQLVCYQSELKDKKGRAIGLYRMIYASSKIAAPALGGIIYQQMGGNILWFICGLLGILCLIMCNYYKHWSLFSSI